jgi:hypothetical protein
MVPDIMKPLYKIRVGKSQFASPHYISSFNSKNEPRVNPTSLAKPMCWVKRSTAVKWLDKITEAYPSAEIEKYYE